MAKTKNKYRTVGSLKGPSATEHRDRTSDRGSRGQNANIVLHDDPKRHEQERPETR